MVCDGGQRKIGTRQNETLVAAPIARKPRARYRVGADARHLLTLKRRSSDAAMDQLCEQIFSSVDPP